MVVMGQLNTRRRELEKKITAFEVACAWSLRHRPNLEILKLLERHKRAVSCLFLIILGLVCCLLERISVVTAEYE